MWSALPGGAWPDLLAHAAAATSASGRGVLLCVPDHKDVARLDAALTRVLGEGRHVVLSADLGPAQRYRSFLAVSRGAVRVVVGTRAAAFAPVRDLGLVAMWDDGDDLYAEPRAPYPHTREVLLTRAQEESAAVLLGGFARTVEAEYLLRTGWAEPLAGRPRAACVPPRPRSPSPARPTASSSATRTPAPPGCPARRYDAVRDGLEQRAGAAADAAAGLRHGAGLRHAAARPRAAGSAADRCG